MLINIAQVRDAIREELDATNTYDRLIDIFTMAYKDGDERFGKYLSILEEIKNDEINHTGRLMNILFELDPKEVEYFNAGLKQKEN